MCMLDEIRAKRDEIYAIARRHKAEKLWVFGSCARKEERPDSDVDILVALDYSQPIGLRFFGMYEDLRALLGRDVDLVSERTLAPFARNSVDRDKKLVYERAN